ncbi:Copia-like polyprotein/retrotransposon [Ceratobasidium theobromae]|uniref:Copia-like polyprotein/retrotransposon n=1 Tax=Ceratobasidium theobromae TaxID=1582974 RepID=A0A5N5Q7L6_9AGAM|nr:Copia-like polyprotein/retrotransposon [Ceratobasidium theobromae]
MSRESSTERKSAQATVSVGGSLSGFRIALLSGPENWRTWKVRMEDTFKDLKIWDVVNGQTTRPDSKASDWDEKDQRALTLIRRCVNEEIMLHVLASATSYEAWEELKKAYEAVDIVALIDLRRRLFWAKMEEGTPIDKHIREMRAVYDQLRAIDENLTNGFDWALCLVNSLPPSWQPFVRTLTPSFNYKDKSEWTKLSRSVTQAVIAEGQRLAHEAKTESSLLVKTLGTGVPNKEG